MAQRLVIHKYGSSVLRNEDDLPAVLAEIYAAVRAGDRVVAVVSAFGDTTERLLRSARRVGVADHPQPAALAQLLATGELRAAALLCLAAERAGIPSCCLDATRLALRTEGPCLDSLPVSLDHAVIERALERNALVVLPGFIGRGADGRTTLLGRGGSDLTALFLAHQLQAHRCRLYKDVDGIYEADPALKRPGHPSPRRFSSLSWAEALRVCGSVVQKKAIRYAECHDQEFEVACLGRAGQTQVGDRALQLEPAPPAATRLRVGLLGLGTVGLGVYRLLRSFPERFELVGIAVRQPDKARPDDVPRELLCVDPWQVLSRGCDVLVELIGGEEPAARLIQAALERGVHVVSANKGVLAQRLEALQRRAHDRGVRLAFSASVGGALPALEAVQRIARGPGVRQICGVLNGTTNFILGQLQQGLPFAAALALAQERGFAEADPSLDLSGEDAADKLRLLCNAAFGQDVPVACQGIRGVRPRDVEAARGEQRVWRLVAQAELGPDGVRAQVQPLPLPREHPLARAIDEENCLLIEDRAGVWTQVRGKGAGRWPTAQAVLADLLDLGQATSPTPALTAA